MEINSFSNNETRLLIINNEIVQITFKLHNESDTSLYIENNDLKDEIKQVIVAFVKFMDEDHIVDGEGYYLLCRKSIWNFGKNCVFYRNDQVISPHRYKYNFELEFASQVISRNSSYDRGRNKSITDSNTKNDFILQLDDNLGTPKSSNNAVNQEIIQRMTARTSIISSDRFDNRQSIFAENTPTALWVNRDTTQRVDNAYIVTPFDNQRQMQKPVDSAYATLFNYRGPPVNNAYITPVDNRGQKFATDTHTSNREYPELTQQSSRYLFGYQETLENVSGTSRKPILVGETFEQTSRTSSIGSQESFIGGNWPSPETTSLDSGSQKISGISKSQFQTPTRQVSNIFSTDDLSNNAFDDGGGPLMHNVDNRLLNEETNEDNRFLSHLRPPNFIRNMFPGYFI